MLTKTKAWRLLAVCVCAVGPALPGLAQEPAIPGVAQEPALPGLAHKTAHQRDDWLKFGVEMGVEYTDNRDASAASATNKESTVDYYVTPRIEMRGDFERTEVDATFAPSLRYRTNPREGEQKQSVFYTGALNVDHTFSPWTKGRVREAISYQDVPAIDQVGRVIRANSSYIQNRLELGVNHDLTPWTFVDVSGSQALMRYQDHMVAQESDVDTLGVNGAVGHHVTPSLDAHVRGSMTSSRYNSTTGFNRDFDTYLGAVGAEEAFTPQFKGGFDLGGQCAAYADESLKSTVNPYASIHSDLAPNPRLHLNGSAEYGLSSSDVYPFASQKRTDFSVGLAGNPSVRTSCGISVTYGLSEYTAQSRAANAPAPQPGEAGSGRETIVGVSAFATWTLSANAHFSLRQRHEDVASDIAEHFTKNTSTASLALDF